MKGNLLSYKEIPTDYSKTKVWYNGMWRYNTFYELEIIVNKWFGLIKRKQTIKTLVELHEKVEHENYWNELIKNKRLVDFTK